MKKLLVVLSLVLLMSIVSVHQALATSTIKVGYDLKGNYQPDHRGGTEWDVASGVSLGYEYTIDRECHEYGLGVEYQLQRGLENSNDAKFNFIPVYAVYNWYFAGDQAKPYLTGRLGYNFINGNDQFDKSNKADGGYYFGFGGGVRFGNLITEVIYSGSHAKPDNSQEMEYNKVSLVLGYKF